MKKNNTTEIFKNAPVPKAVLINAVPAIISMIMVLIYNLADTFFIGKTGVGEMLTAVSIVTPAFLIFMAIGMLFGIGSTSLVSRRLGEGDKSIAKKVSSFCFWTGMAVGVICMVLVLVFLDPLCRLIGAKTQATFEYTRTYFSIIALCIPFLIVSNAFSNLIRAEGKANVAMLGMVIGNLLNVVLDPVMIFGFNWGIAGAAVATVIGNVFACAFYFVNIVFRESIFSLNPKYFQARGVFFNIVKIGFPASLNSILLSLSNIIANLFIVAISEDAVGGLGVAFKVNMITVMLLIGLGSGIQPLLGYCYGSKNVKRFSEVMKFSCTLALIMSVVMSLITYVLAVPLVQAFVNVESQVAYGSEFVKILVISGPILGILFVMINALQGMGAAVPSLVMSASRQGIFYIPLLLIITALTNTANWIVMAQPITDYFATALSVLLFLRTYKKFKQSATVENSETAEQADLPNVAE